MKPNDGFSAFLDAMRELPSKAALHAARKKFNRVTYATMAETHQDPVEQAVRAAYAVDQQKPHCVDALSAIRDYADHALSRPDATALRVIKYMATEALLGPPPEETRPHE